ncbi:hypothetical protein BuS5_00802 [Desulfosarcina sp. BuS5]|uniref:formyltransferase family protein n=1 Tax=Desulfosarcina sp. BuS5 TaxID=933262 RepID=UPI00048412B3|nr:formyltransferase family protein [Desulfosarcina sp. BuS5]WDN87834.1 hypothetical protein BuS5_00802 [Desulfosarcina sp. BuS5]
MVIAKNQLLGFEAETEELNWMLADVTSEVCNKYIPKFSDILDKKQIHWDEIKYLFKKDFRKFDKLLFNLHFKRNKNFSELQRERILIFLSIGYLNSKDVRYFNEFLHFYKKTDNNKKYWLLMVKTFFDNLTESNHHPFPLCDNQEIESFMHKIKNNIELSRNKKVDTSLRVGLLGSPTFFKKIRDHLISNGFDVRCYFIPYHTNRKINFLLKNRFLFRLLCLSKRINFRFLQLDFSYKDPRIGEQLKKDKLDIGFHKLGFIIKKNIIEQFKIGIINDHWAILPYIRGRSTIEYSLLFGIPVVATAHIVEEGVDSGDIVSFYRYDNVKNKYSKISQIRNHIRREMEFRAIDAIEILSRNKGPIAQNRPEKGLMFYSMHPLLKKFIENNVLKKNCLIKYRLPTIGCKGRQTALRFFQASAPHEVWRFFQVGCFACLPPLSRVVSCLEHIGDVNE